MVKLNRIYGLAAVRERAVQGEPRSVLVKDLSQLGLG